MSQSIQELIAGYRQGLEAMENALRGVSEEIVDVPPAPGKWTIRQIVVHNTDFEAVTAMRIRLFAAQPGCPMTAWDQDVWAEKLLYTKQPFGAAAQTFVALRRYNADLLANLPEEVWQNTCEHEERGTLKMIDLMEYTVQHALKHAEQIKGIRQKLEK